MSKIPKIDDPVYMSLRLLTDIHDYGFEIYGNTMCISSTLVLTPDKRTSKFDAETVFHLRLVHKFTGQCPPAVIRFEDYIKHRKFTLPTNFNLFDRLATILLLLDHHKVLFDPKTKQFTDMYTEEKIHTYSVIQVAVTGLPTHPNKLSALILR